MIQKKYYVVWKGLAPGIYSSWAECKKQVEGFKGPLYKSFPSLESATLAYREEPDKYFTNIVKPSETIVKESLAVDAACSGNPGKLEYRGVYVLTGEEIFHIGPINEGTNNIGEFLGLVHALALLKKQKLAMPVYSDSVNAIKWVKEKKCKTKLEPVAENAYLFDLIQRAEQWLIDNQYTTQILKWNTEQWGEIPADFGRK